MHAERGVASHDAAADRGDSSQHAASENVRDEIMPDIRALGRVLKDYGNTTDADQLKEFRLARILRRYYDA